MADPIGPAMAAWIISRRSSRSARNWSSAPNRANEVDRQACGHGNRGLGLDDRSDNEQGFMIARAEKSNGAVGSFDLIDEVGHGATGYTDSTAQSGVTYLYQVAAFNVAATNCAPKCAVVTVE